MCVCLLACRDVRPNILWAQRRDKVTISIYLTDIRDEKCTVEGNKFCFRLGAREHTPLCWCSSGSFFNCSGVAENGQHYKCDFDLYKEIIPEVSISKSHEN